MKPNRDFSLVLFKESALVHYLPESLVVGRQKWSRLRGGKTGYVTVLAGERRLYVDFNQGLLGAGVEVWLDDDLVAKGDTAKLGANPIRQPAEAFLAELNRAASEIRARL